MNTTFTNCAEKKAKQFLNLLQGYTKGIRITAILILLLMGVSNAWAASEGSSWYDWASSENVYFDNTNSSYSNVSMLIGRQWNYGSDGVGSSGVNFTKVANTNNLYHAATTWSHYNTLLFMDAKDWGWEGNKVTSRYIYASNYTNTNNVNINGTELFYAASSTKGATLNHQDLTSYTALNYTQTIQQHLSTDGGNNYSASTTALATVTVSSYELDSKNTTTSTSGTIVSGSSSATCSAARTATVTYTVSGVKTGYTFVGWYDGTTQKSTDTTYTYNATEAKTITARFKENTYSVTISAGTGGTVSPSGSKTIGQVTKTTVTATPNANYEFVNWTATGGVVVANTSSVSTTITATAAGTLTANFRSTATNSLTVVAGANIESVTGSADPVTLGNTYNIEATPKTGYTFSTWTANPAANATFGSETTANTTVTVKNGSVTVTASATENMSTLTTSNNYDAGNPGYAVPSATVSKIGIATPATVTAAAAGNGYTFTGWTFTNCTRTDGGADNATSITVRSNGDGKEATIVANYAEDCNTMWVLAHSIDGFNTSSHPFVKKSGESTGKVAYVSLDLAANTAYTFKVKNGDKWYGNNNSDEQYWIKATAENWEFYSDAGDCHMKSSVAGTYTFKIDFSGTYPKVSVQFPTAYKITYGVGTNKGTDEVTTTPSITSGSLVLASTSITFSKGDTIAGYTWKNWNSKADGTGTVLGTGDTYVSSNRAGDITVYACYDLITYDITYNLNGGDGATNTTYNVESATITLPTDLTKIGYTFAGWYDNANLTGNKVTQVAKGSTGDKAFWVKWTPNTYNITYKDQGGSNFSGTHTSGYPTKHTYGTATTLSTATKDGYTFEGWHTDQECTQKVTSLGATAYTAAITLYAKWTANTYTVTLDQEGADEKGDASASADYNADMPKLGKLPTAQNGYAFMGYWDGKDGTGTQYYNADGTSAHVWDKAENATLYAFFKMAELTITLNKQTFDPEASEVVATPTIAPTPEGDVAIYWSLLYSSGSEVPNHTVNVDGEGKATFNISDLATGQYKIKAVLKTGNTELDIEYANFTIASNYTITVRYTCDGKDIAASTKEDAHVNQAKEITAPEITGYTFKEWKLGDGVSSESSLSKKTIEVTAFYDGFLTATYTRNNSIIYFYNTLGWENVYVYFYSGDYWDNNKGTGTKSGGTYKGYLPMVRMGESNIWYVNAADKATTYLVFGKDEQDNYNNFSDTEVIRRGDYNSSLPMFVPIADQTPTLLNEYTDKEGKDCVTKYYNKGYWMNYPENTGYTLDLFNHHSDNDPARYIIYPYSKNTIFPLQLQVEINAENVVDGAKKIWFRIHRNDGKNFGGDYTNFPTVKPTTTDGFIAENDYKVELITPIAGTYTFTLDYRYNEKTEDYQYHIEVDYPAKVGDYRILYRDEAETNWSGNTKPIGWYHPSRVIKKGEDRKDIISFYINKDVGRSLSYQTIESINDNTGAIQWSATEVPFNNIDWSKITKSGVYNFTFVQDGKSISLENNIEPYTGNYYIRTDAMGGGWEDYKTNSENRMTYSSFSESEANSFGEKFSHYAVKWCKAGTNVKFTIANDYSQCISDTLAQDVIPLGNLTDEGTLQNREIYDANIRFMWNWKTNKISRAYIGPAGDKQSQFLMLQSCSEFKDAAGNDLDPNEGDILDKENDIYAARFADTQNWIYERTLQVKPGTRVKLYASYPKVYHIYIENKTGWQDVALYAWKDGGDQPLGNWPGIQPTRTVEIESKTYYDFQVSEYVFGSNLIFNGNGGEQQKDNYQIQTIGDYYLTASSSNSQLSFVKNVSTTVEATAQYFRGAYAGGSWEDEHTVEILGGNGDVLQTIRVIYDFKTNRLMRAWVPSGDISGEQAINADLMVIREHQENATCITFANDGSKLSEVKTVYGTIRFNRWTLNNRANADDLNVDHCTKVDGNHRVYDEDITNQYHPVLPPAEQVPIYERGLYFISFPFDVHLSDVFGFGQYGTHWVISTYNGLRRAQRGYFDQDCINEDCSNWDYIWDPSDFTMEANVGYLLSIDLDLMKYDNTDFWMNNISTVELMFPSKTNLETIQKTNYVMPALGEEYKCNINNQYADRTVKDSYWRCIGVPSFADYSGVLKDGNDESITWQPEGNTFPFLYEWNTTDNSLMVQSTSNYKFRSTFAYLVQNGNAIHWSVVNAKPSQIVARQRSAEQESNYEWNIALLNGEKKEDQTFLRMSDLESVTTEFDFGQDLSKEFNYGRSEIYTLIGTNQVAANSLPLSDHTTVVSLGLDIDKAGDYTIAMPEGVMSVGVTLYDAETGTRTNLSAGMEYTIALNKGVCDNRLYLEISPIQNDAPTDIENIGDGVNNGETVKKYLIDGKLVIRTAEGAVYDAQGHVVQ